MYTKAIGLNIAALVPKKVFADKITGERVEIQLIVLQDSAVWRHPKEVG